MTWISAIMWLAGAGCAPAAAQASSGSVSSKGRRRRDSENDGWAMCIFPSAKMQDQRAFRAAMPAREEGAGGPVERASLREDYLNQVQRDSLSQRALRLRQHPQRFALPAAWGGRQSERIVAAWPFAHHPPHGGTPEQQGGGECAEGIGGLCCQGQCAARQAR
jgi:hypothetical protein